MLSPRICSLGRNENQNLQSVPRSEFMSHLLYGTLLRELLVEIQAVHWGNWEMCRCTQRKVFLDIYQGGLDLLLSTIVIYTNTSARYISRRSSLFSPQIHGICSFSVWKAQRRITSPCQTQNQNKVLYPIINRLLFCKNSSGMESPVGFSQPAIP